MIDSWLSKKVLKGEINVPHLIADAAEAITNRYLIAFAAEPRCRINCWYRVRVKVEEQSACIKDKAINGTIKNEDTLSERMP